MRKVTETAGTSRERIVGYDLDARPAAACIEDVLAWVRGRGSCRYLACLNPHSYVVARADPRFAEALRGAHWLVPDGIGVVLASRVLGGGLRGRVTGSDVFEGLHARLDEEGGGRVFFLGSTEETLARIRARMAVDHPRVEVVGARSPPFRPAHTAEEVDEMVAAVNAAEADVLWVGMTAPKQEKWLLENRERLAVPFAAAVGAVFDFYAGSVRRTSPAFRRLGLEWLPRLLREPRRLWRRTLVSAPVFALDVLRARLGGRR